MRAVLGSVLAAVVVVVVVVVTAVAYTVYQDRGATDPTGTASATPPVGAFAAGTTMQRLNEARKISIGIKTDEPGFGFRESDGRLTGFEVELGRLIASELGVPATGITWIETQSSIREQSIESAAVDVVIATYIITETRKQRVDFAGPYYTAGQRLMVRADNPTSITQPESLRTGNQKVCSVTGSTPAQTIRQYLTDVPRQLVLFNVYQKCVDALLGGTVDAVTTDNVILIGYLSRYPQQLQLVGPAFTTEPYGIGVRKGDTPFRNWLNDFLDRIAKNGRYQKAWQDTAGTWDPVLPSLPVVVRY